MWRRPLSHEGDERAVFAYNGCMTGKIVLFAGIGLVAAAAAVMLWLAASGVSLWPETKAASAGERETGPVDRAVQTPGSGTTSLTTGAEPESGAGSAPPVPHESPAFDASTFGARCMTFAKRSDTDPRMLAADQRMCDCFGRTLKPADYEMMLAYTDIDPKGPDAATRYAALYGAYGLTDAQYATELNRIRRAGKSCVSAH